MKFTRQVVVHFSADGSLYYVGGVGPFGFWLPVKTEPETENYARPFTFWKVREGWTENRPTDDELVVRYRQHEADNKR